MYANTHKFWFLGRSERSANSRVRLWGPRQNSQIWSILASFVCYYLLCLGPGPLQTLSELSGTVTGTSSKLADLVHSGQFCKLLLSDFISRGDPNVPRTLRTSYGDLVKTRIFGPFSAVLYAITHCIWVLGRYKPSGNSGDRLRGPC